MEAPTQSHPIPAPNRARQHVESVLIGVAFSLFLALWAPYERAIQYGAEEGPCFVRGVACSQGASLYSQVWSDRPPFHAFLLKHVFHAFPATAGPARAATIPFAGLLAGCFHALIRQSTGRWAARLGLLLLAQSAYFLRLCVTGSDTIPGLAIMCLALVVLAPGLSSPRPHPRRDALIAGALGAAAFFTHWPTLVFVVPMLAWLVARRNRQEAPPAPPGKYPDPALCWLIGAALVSLVLVPSLFGTGPFRAFRDELLDFVSHPFGNQADRPGLHELLFQDLPLALLSCGGAVLPWTRRRPAVAFAGGTLVIAYLAHWVGASFSYDHFLDLAFPMAWLASVGVDATANRFVARPPTLVPAHLEKVQTPLAWMHALLAFTMLASIPSRLVQEWNRVRSVERVDQSEAIAYLRTFQGVAGGIYTDQSIWAFHAGLRVIPELLGLTPNRVASGHLTYADIAAAVKRQRPALAVVHDSDNLQFAACFTPEYERASETTWPLVYRRR